MRFIRSITSGEHTVYLSSNIYNTSAITFSLNSSSNSAQSPLVPVSPKPKVLAIATLVQATNDDMKLHSSVRESVKVKNLTHSIESAMPKVVSAYLISEPTLPKQQSLPKPCLLDHQTNHTCRLNGHKEGFCTLHSFRTHGLFTLIKFQNCLDQCSQIQTKPKLDCRPIR